MRLPALVAVVCACLLAGVPASAQDDTPQDLFKKVLVADPKLASGVKRLLETKAGFVSPSPVFADLTGDGKSDAVVTVDNGGAAGVVAAYVLSAEGSAKGDLRVALRNQSLYQGRVRVSGTTLTIAEPLWSRGDDVCCPRRATERDYAWDAAKKAFTRRATRTVSLLDR
jgi:ribulose 1,5-bisphosphate synthetase/thiazole synthase